MSEQQNNYYNVGEIAVIDYIKAKLTPEAYKGFLEGNVIKYVSRAAYKGDELADLKKAQEYLGWLIEAVESGAAQ